MTLALFVALSSPLVSVEIPASAPQLVFDQLGPKIGAKLVVGKGLEDQFLVVRFREKSKDHILAKVAEAMDGQWRADGETLTLLPDPTSKRAKIRRDALTKFFAEELDKLPRDLATPEETREVLRDRIRALTSLQLSDRTAANQFRRTMREAAPMDRLARALARSLGPEFFADHYSRPWVMGPQAGKARMAFGSQQRALIDASQKERQSLLELFAQESKGMPADQRRGIWVAMGGFGPEPATFSPSARPAEVLFEGAPNGDNCFFLVFEAPFEGKLRGFINFPLEKIQSGQLLGADPEILVNLGQKPQFSREEQDEIRWITQSSSIEGKAEALSLLARFRQKVMARGTADALLGIPSRVMLQVAAAADRDLVAVLPDEAVFSLASRLSAAPAAPGGTRTPNEQPLSVVFRAMRPGLGEVLTDDGTTIVSYPLDRLAHPRIERGRLQQWVASVGQNQRFNLRQVVRQIVEVLSMGGSRAEKLCQMLTLDQNLYMPFYDEMSNFSEYRLLDSLTSPQLDAVLGGRFAAQSGQLSPTQLDHCRGFSANLTVRGAGGQASLAYFISPDGLPEPYGLKITPTVYSKIGATGADGEREVWADTPAQFGSELESAGIKLDNQGQLPGLTIDVVNTLALTFEITLPGGEGQIVAVASFVTENWENIQFRDLPQSMRDEIERGRKLPPPAREGRSASPAAGGGGKVR